MNREEWIAHLAEFFEHWPYTDENGFMILADPFDAPGESLPERAPDLSAAVGQ
jgi:hypothetical protein